MSRAGHGNSASYSLIQSVTGSATVGGPAPSITWRDAVSGKPVRLSDFKGKPVVLFQGSCTCPPFRAAAGMIEQIAARYRGRVHSFFVYSREAHPFVGTTEYTLHPKTLEDRQRAARDLIAESGITMPVLIDGLSNRMEKVCGNIPSRILVIDAGGKVAYLSGDPVSNMAVPIPGVLDGLLAPEETASGGRAKTLPAGEG